VKRTIHIWELPVNRVYINLRKDFREDLFNAAKVTFGTWDKLGKYLGVPRGDTTIACNWKGGKHCFPLIKALMVCKLAKVSKYELEKNIIEIRSKTKLLGRGGNSGKPIKKPKLPIKINEDFIELLGHICGDGSIVKTSNKGMGLKYINSEPLLIESFQKLVKQIFGDVEPNVQTRSHKPHYRRPNYYLQYSTILSLFILTVFYYRTGKDMLLPPFIFECSTKEKCKFLRALFDDEGSALVRNKRIQFVIKPEKPFSDIRNLVSSNGIHVSKSYTMKNGVHKFEIASGDGVQKFAKLIGFKHPTKKQKLDKIIQTGWKFKRYPNGFVKIKIFSILKRKDSTVKELVAEIGRCRETINSHLNNLKKENLVKNKRIIKQGASCILWSLNNGKNC